MAIFSLHDELFFHKRKFLIQLFSTQKIAILDNEISIFYLKEAKSSCAGQWYLPAGRMDPGEDVFEAAKREVFEETGIHFEPSTLLLVETAG